MKLTLAFATLALHLVTSSQAANTIFACGNDVDEGFCEENCDCHCSNGEVECTGSGITCVQGDLSSCQANCECVSDFTLNIYGSGDCTTGLDVITGEDPVDCTALTDTNSWSFEGGRANTDDDDWQLTICTDDACQENCVETEGQGCTGNPWGSFKIDEV